MKASLNAESLGAYTGIVGALILALNIELSGYGWLWLLASNIAWAVFAIRNRLRKLFLQQVAFFATSLLGIWRALIAQSELGHWLGTFF